MKRRIIVYRGTSFGCRGHAAVTCKRLSPPSRQPTCGTAARRSPRAAPVGAAPPHPAAMARPGTRGRWPHLGPARRPRATRVLIAAGLEPQERAERTDCGRAASLRL